MPKKNFFRGNQVVFFVFFKVEQETTLNIWYFYLFILLRCNIGWITVIFCFLFFTGLCVFVFFFFKKNGKAEIVGKF